MDTTHFTDRLHTEKEQLVTDLQSIAVYNEDSNEWTAIPDPADTSDADDNVEADGVEEWNTRRATVGNLNTRYRNLTRALEKIADGSYGRCEVAGELIEMDRLEVNPAARTCKAHLHEEGSLSL